LSFFFWTIVVFWCVVGSAVRASANKQVDKNAAEMGHCFSWWQGPTTFLRCC